MDFNTMQEELRKLSEMVAGWSSLGRITPLERDLALDKLRTLYEAVRFGAEPVAAAESVSAPASIPVPESESEPAESVAEPKASSADEQSSPVSIDLDDMLALDAEPLAAVSAEPSSADAAEFAAEYAAEPNLTPAAEPEVAIPSLFGPEEEEALRHRRKQRVIMSLYDTTPAPAAKPAPAVAQAAAAVQPEKWTVAAKPEPKPAEELAAAVNAEFAENPEPVSAEPVSAEPTEPAESVEPAAESAALAEPSEPESCEVVPESKSATEPIIEPETESEPAAEPLPEPEPESEPEPEPEISEAPAASESEPAQTPATAGAVLGEVINPHRQTLADTLAAPQNMATALRRNEKITDLQSAIGINDKFLLIRDLFVGDAAAYGVAIDTLNGFDNLDDCMIYIAENYTWNPNCDGAKLIMELLERKFA